MKGAQALARDLSSESGHHELVQEQISILHADEFERSCAMKWLTGLIAHSDEWTELGVNDGDVASQECRNRERVVERASALLAACSGSSACGAVTRSFTYYPRLSYQQGEWKSGTSSIMPIHIHLRDGSFSAQDQTALGLQTWGSAPTLAQLVSGNPGMYGLDLAERFGGDDEGRNSVEHRGNIIFKVLELGAGTGLLSLFTWRILEKQIIDHAQSGRALSVSSSVTATDFHPSVLSNLNSNLTLNPPSPIMLTSCPPPLIEATFLDWNDCAVLDDEERFDVVFGVDVIYEKEHAQLIRGVVESVLRRPTMNRSENEGTGATKRHTGGGIFWLIYPLRPTHGFEVESTQMVFGPVVEASRCPENAGEGDEERDWCLGVLDIQSLEKSKGIGRGDNVSYRVLKIGWVSKAR